MTQQDAQPPAETLKPCPHCGNDGTGPVADALHVVHVQDADHVAYDRYTVQCDKCTATMGYSDSEDEAVSAWNTRVGGDAGTIDRCIKKLEETARWSINDGRKWFNHPAANEAFEYAIAALRTVEPCAGGDAIPANAAWDHRYRPLIWGEVIQPTDECRRDDGTWVTGICVGEKAPDPSYTSHRIYRRLRLYDVVQEALEFACLTLAFHGRDRGTPRQEKMLDDLEVLARRLDTTCRTATKPKPGGAAEWQDRLDWDGQAQQAQDAYNTLTGKD